jgi:hypothetical protein
MCKSTKLRKKENFFMVDNSIAIQGIIAENNLDIRVAKSSSDPVFESRDTLTEVLRQLQLSIEFSRDSRKICSIKASLEDLRIEDQEMQLLVKGVISVAQENLTFAQKHSLKSSTTSMREVLVNLDRWEFEGDSEAHTEAKRRIIEFLEDKTLKKLNLSCLELFALPEVFEASFFSERLEELNISHNSILDTLPNSLTSLKALLKLEIFNTGIRCLPEKFGNLTRLLKVNLSNNKKLIALPNSFGNLINLKELNLSLNSNLEELPSTFCGLIHLKKLKLSSTKISVFPESFEKLVNLQTLSLFETKFRELPEWISNFSRLQTLDLFGTDIAAIPQSIGRLRFLENLDLSNTLLLSSLPNSILDLPRNCEINLQNSGLSETVLQRLEEVRDAEEVFGPRFNFSMRRIEGEESFKSTQELLEDLCEIVGKKTRSFKNLPQDSEVLRSWLSRLSFMADYKSRGDKQKALINNVLSYLKEANKNSGFRESFMVAINDASETCGDRVALSVLKIGIIYQIATTNLYYRNIGQLAELLKRGVWALDLLEGLSREKVSSLRFVDEIEVYLGYPVMLKDRLSLPINIEEMLYFYCSYITADDLDIAEEYVNSHLNNEEAFHEFLIGHDVWRDALETFYESKMHQIKQLQETDYAEAKQKLLKLTRRALGLESNYPEVVNSAMRNFRGLFSKKEF